MSVEILKITDTAFMVNHKIVEIYRDMDGDVVTNPILEFYELKAFRNYINAKP